MLRKLMVLKLLKNHFKLFDAFQLLTTLLKQKSSVHLKQLKITLYFRKESKDYETFEEIFLKNIYDTALPFSPQTIVDAGANVGFASIFFKLKYPKAHILAIEIEKHNIEMIKKNTSQITNFEVVSKALFNKKAYFKIENPFNATNSFQINETEDLSSYDIESITIDEIFAQKNWKTIDILKIDIEGAEKQLFEDNYQTWLPKIKVIMIETHDRMLANCSLVVIKALSDFNFILYTTTEGTLIFYNKNLIIW